MPKLRRVQTKIVTGATATEAEDNANAFLADQSEEREFVSAEFTLDGGTYAVLIVFAE